MHFSSSAALLLLASYVSAAPVIVTQVITQTVHVPAGSKPTTAPAAAKAVNNEVNIAGLSVPKGPTTVAATPAATTTSVYVAPPAPPAASSSSVPSTGGGNNDGYTDPGAGEKGATVKFRTLDKKTRKIVFTPGLNTGSKYLDPIEVGPGKDYPYTFPHGWEGNYQAFEPSVKDTSVTGMMGEIKCNGYAGAHYFDVSSEKNQRKDWDGVKQMFPEKAQFPMSGCNTWPCNNVYICWNDEQTKATHENTLIQTLGDGEGYTMDDKAYWAKDTRQIQTCAFRTENWNKWFNLA